MKFNLSIDQVRAYEWRINLQQATIFSFIYGAASWADQEVIDGKIYTHVSRHKCLTEIPILEMEPDTIYRQYKFLHTQGLIEYRKVGKKDYARLTDKGKLWNTDGNSEKNPSFGEKNSEKNPTYNITNNSTEQNKGLKAEKEEKEFVAADSQKTENIESLGFEEYTDRLRQTLRNHSTHLHKAVRLSGVSIDSFQQDFIQYCFENGRTFREKKDPGIAKLLLRHATIVAEKGPLFGPAEEEMKLPEDFQAFYNAYPGTRRPVEQEYQHFLAAARKARLSEGDLIEKMKTGLKNYRAWIADQTGYTPNICSMKTWFSEKRWEQVYELKNKPVYEMPVNQPSGSGKLKNRMDKLNQLSNVRSTQGSSSATA